MKRRLIPPFLMLFAGIITSIIMFRLHYEMKTMLVILLGVLFSFYIVGFLLKMMLDIFDKQNSKIIVDEDKKELNEAMAGKEGQVNSEG